MKNFAEGRGAAIDEGSCVQRSFAAPVVIDTGKVVVELDRAEALGVGYSLKALARDGRPNAETAAQLERVGDKLVNAARGPR